MTHPMLQELQRRIGRFPVEWPAAAMLAAAVAFTMLVLPDWRFQALVNSTGLPSLVSAAQPPLGQTARILAALAAGAVAFAAVWYGLRALDRPVAANGDFPAFRAADLHPDAPKRRPILAGAEFGPPSAAPPVEQEPARKRKLVLDDTLPSFLAPQPPEFAEFEYAPIETDAEPGSRIAAEPEASQPTWLVPAQIDEPEDPDAAEAVAEAGRAPGTGPGYSPLVMKGSARVRTGSEAANQNVAEGEDGFSGDDRPRDDQTIGELMARLERGYASQGAPTEALSDRARKELERVLDELDRVSKRA